MVNSAIGGSTNAPIHITAIARHVGVDLEMDDWQRLGLTVPLLVDLQPAGRFLGEEFHRAGGVPAVVHELMAHGLIHEGARTVSGSDHRGELPRHRGHRPRRDPHLRRRAAARRRVPGAARQPVRLRDHEDQRDLAGVPASATCPTRTHPNVLEGRAIVFDGPEDYHARIDDPELKIDEDCLLFMRGAGPLGYPGAAEVVNMQPPAELIKRGVHALPCIGDGRQSGTSGSPSILNASPEAAAGGGLALLRTGDPVRIDLNAGTADMLLPDEELAQRRRELEAAGGYPMPAVADAVAGDPAGHGRPAGRRHGAAAGRRLPARRSARAAPRQPLSHVRARAIPATNGTLVGIQQTRVPFVRRIPLLWCSIST